MRNAEDLKGLPGQPGGYIGIIPVPQDALGMGAMMGGGIEQAGAWERASTPYKSGRDARILMMYGRVHNGGIHTEIVVNGKVACDSVAYYQDMKIPANQITKSAGNGGHSHKERTDGGNSRIIAFGECLEVG